MLTGTSWLEVWHRIESLYLLCMIKNCHVYDMQMCQHMTVGPKQINEITVINKSQADFINPNYLLQKPTLLSSLWMA